MELDYENLGLKIEIEVHQQLDTGKLFCSGGYSLLRPGGKGSDG